MTIREVYLYIENVVEIKQQENEKNDYRLATLMAHMQNLKTSKKSKMVTAETFLKKKRLKKNRKPQSSRMMAEIL